MSIEYLLMGDKEQIYYITDKVITPNKIKVKGFYDVIFEDEFLYGVSIITSATVFKNILESKLEHLIQYRIIIGNGFSNHALKRVEEPYHRCEDLVSSGDLVLLLDVAEDSQDTDYAIIDEEDYFE